MWPHYIYLHRKNDTGEPFYVGKGKLRRVRRKPIFERAYALRPTNVHWMRIVARHGHTVEIVAHCQTDDDAQWVERHIIAQIGRADLTAGPLINRTDGGDGHAGIVVSDELRGKRRINASGKRSEAWVVAIREVRRNGGNGGVVKLGDKLPAGWVTNLARAKLGSANPYFGKPTGISRKVVNTITGIVYDSIARAADAEGVTRSALYQYLEGTRPNKTALALL